MLTRPADLSDATLEVVLEREWGMRSPTIAYLPVGAGSHHWRVDDFDAHCWFVTVDDLDARRDDPSESRSSVFHRLSAALTTAHALHETGAGYVIAPLAARDGEVLHCLRERWAVAVYPMVAGETFRGGQALPVADRLSVLEVIARLHQAPRSARARALADDYQLQNRADLESAVNDQRIGSSTGPYSERLADLLAAHRALIADLLSEYDDLVSDARSLRDRHVLTHGEPHAGNTMRTAAGWVLVDWDTALVAAPERDLCLLEPGDGLASTTYTNATGTPIFSAMLDLFRLRWDLSDLGVDVARLRAPHGASADVDRSWKGVTSVLTRRSAGDTVPPASWR